MSGSVSQAEARLRTRLDAALRRVYGVRGFESALSEERAAMMREVRDQLRPDATSLGLEIEDVRIRRTDLTQEVSQQTYDRMKAERLAEAERLRARGREAAQRIRARADREVVEIVAEARKESEILRGEGEAQRNGIFADAFQRDPGFFEFYRSMIAYSNALLGTGTTMVLSPNSEFFRYFRSPNGGTTPAARDTAAAPQAGTRPVRYRRRARRPPNDDQRQPISRRLACRTSWPPSAWSSSSRAWSMAAFRGLRNVWRPKFSVRRKTCLRTLGLASIAAGVGIVWLVRG